MYKIFSFLHINRLNLGLQFCKLLTDEWTWVSCRLMLVLNCSGSSRGTRKGYNKLAGEESEVNNVNCTAPQCVVQESSGPGHGPGPGGPDSSDTDSNCTDLELEEEISDDSDYGEYTSHWRAYSFSFVPLGRYSISMQVGKNS
jgi:hypothetical protein